ncbi:MAG TPA: non-canonical purine NTP phosphatase [Chloroflexi bacterium]|nr:non-canonical purine NTP phosphatase [Chloroflexota bacterium]
MPSTIIIASHNPVKIAAARGGFQQMFPEATFVLRGVEVPSGVRDQPLSEEETRQGARNRAARAAEIFPQADYWVGIEGGLHPDGETFLALAWVCIRAADGSRGEGRTGAFHLPPAIAALIRQGKELGEADDIVFGQNNSKQKNGAVGLLTGNLIDRTRFYEQAVILALIPLHNKALWDGK